MNLENNLVESICRVCLEKCKKLYPLEGSVPNVEGNISRMIKYCTLIEVIMEDDLPKGVCIPCFKTIRIAYNFINQFKESNRKLLEDSYVIKQGYSNKEENLSEIKLETESEQELYSENVEEIIIEYVTEDLNGDSISDSASISISEEICEAKAKSFSLKNEIMIYDDSLINNVCEGSSQVHIKEEHNVEEYLDISADGEPQDLEQSNLILQNQCLQSFTCPICGQSFRKFEVGFVKHLLTHRGTKLNCDKCSLETVLTVDLYIQHFRKSHKFECVICNKSYGRSSGLYYHIKTHYNKKIYKCSFVDCTKSFLTKWCLRKHLHTHSQSSKFVCSKCGIEFKTYGTYKYHQKTHDGNRSYLCTECGQTFLQSIHLKYHMWKHTGIKMFRCDKCHKSYTSQTQLKKHKKNSKTCGFASKVPT